MLYSSFLKGQPTSLYVDEMHPDWAPTVAMGHGHSTTTHSTNDGCLGRYNRSKERTKKRRLDNTTSVDNITQQTNDGNLHFANNLKTFKTMN